MTSRSPFIHHHALTNFPGFSQLSTPASSSPSDDEINTGTTRHTQRSSPAMVALARAAPSPRLFLRSTTSSSKTTAASPQPSPGRTRAVSNTNTIRGYITCYAAATTCLRATAAPTTVIPQQQQQRRSFRCTASLRHDLARRSHYERLQVPPTASPGDIKKSFYRLSKAHHPDANRNDPNAAHTFSLLSESYTLLSDPSRRAVYDRDVLPRFHPSSTAPPHGSYHSSAHHSAGGRPASGLSKRRGTFRGPPPSFYRNGGWGAHAEKRQRAHEGTSAPHYTNYEGAGAQQQQQQQEDPGGRARREEDDVPPHFDKEAHRRTHEHEDRRRWARRHRRSRALDEEGVEFEPQASLGAHFAIVLGILGATVLVPVWYWNTVSGRRKKEY